jgi:capsular exopolysaccharide synthesis family protein
MSPAGDHSPADGSVGTEEVVAPAFWGSADVIPDEPVTGTAGAETVADGRERTDASKAASAAGDSLTVAAGTMVSRITGLARFAVVGAVLGPTYAGNTYQFTNSMPNLVYYGFLAGALFPSLLIPALVRHIDAGDRRATERVAGGFLGVMLVALLAVSPAAVILGPLALKTAALGGPHAVSAAEVSVGRLLIVMVLPQMFLYSVVGSAAAVMNAHRRFALAASAPAVENLGTIAVLLVTGAVYGTGRSITDLPAGEVLLLGLGSTAAVTLHASVQWWGARRAGVALLPRLGWRDTEVLAVARRGVPALAQAGLEAFQVLVLLVAANRLPGGIVAFQIAMSFYFLSTALGTTPVALSLMPRLSRMHLDGDTTAFRDTLVRGLALGFFVTIPTGVGYLVLAVPFARAISFGRMDSALGVAMVAGALAALAAAVIAQTAFMIATYASYARKDTRSPLRSMVMQTVVCLSLVSLSLLVHGPAVLVVLGLAVSGAASAAACHLMARMWRTLDRHGTERLAPSVARFAVGACIMAGPAWLTATAVSGWLGPRVGAIAAVLVGAAIFVAVQAWWRAPEVTWLSGGLGQMRNKAKRTMTEPSMAIVGTPPGTSPGTSAPPPQPPPPQAPPPRWLPGQHWDDHLPRHWLIGAVLIGAALIGAAAAGAMTTFGPLKALAAVLVLAVIGCVWRWPALAAYLAIALTPLTVSLSIGHSLPLIRPNEAIDLLVGAALAMRGIVMARTGRLPKIRLDKVELAMVLMAVCNSVIPLLWMTVRQEQITQEDLLYALVMWKLLGLYVIVRFAVSTDRQVRRCLWLSVAAAVVVALVAVLQSLALFGVPRLLAEFFQGSSQSGPAGGRGSSLLGQPLATGDLMVFNLAIVAALWIRYRRHRLALAAAAVLLVFGALAAGEFSAAIGLVVGVICIAIVVGSPRLLAYFVPAAVIGGLVLSPVIAERLSGFQSASGLPQSWSGRLQNLETYFWPKLFSDWNFVLGVRPAARILIPSAPPSIIAQGTGFVWIESGYTWLLWGGGIPLLISFCFFTWVTARRGWQAARAGVGASSVAGSAVFVATIVIAVLMIFDPHLTYRGSADDFFFLIALVAPRAGRGGQPGTGYDQAAERENDGGSMPPDNAIRNGNGHLGRLQRFGSSSRSRSSPHWPADHDQGTRQPTRTTRELRPGPARPGLRSRFLIAHARWIAAVTLAAICAAFVLTLTQTRVYQAQAVVLIEPAAVAAGSGQPPDMATEEGVVSSDAVLGIASRSLHVPINTLASGLSTKVPGTTSLLQIRYSDPDPRIAQQRAQAIAQAYVKYRPVPKTTAASSKSAASAPVSTAPSASLITAASLPTSPASPNTKIDIGVALIVGLALGIGSAALRDRLDDHLRGSLDLEAQAAVPVLAVIPAFRVQRRDPAGRLVMITHPDSAAAEAYRNLRTRLVETANSRNAKTLLVTSPGGEDKSTVAANLAAALAQSGRSVVLICADLRWGRTHELFGLQREDGLAGFLTRRTSLMEAFQPTAVPGLRLLPPGAIPADPGALLQSPALRTAVGGARRHADVVIIEAPPMLASPDVGPLADTAEMALVVADARRSTRTQVYTAVREADQVRAILAGCVLDNVGKPRRLRWHGPKPTADGRFTAARRWLASDRRFTASRRWVAAAGARFTVFRRWLAAAGRRFAGSRRWLTAADRRFAAAWRRSDDETDTLPLGRPADRGGQVGQQVSGSGTAPGEHAGLTTAHDDGGPSSPLNAGRW